MEGNVLMQFAILVLFAATRLTSGWPADPAPSDPCVHQGTAPTGETRKWPGGVIPYHFSADLTGAKIELMSSMQIWENLTCVVFIPWTEQQDYVIFEPGESCCSFVGKFHSGKQRVYVHSSCSSGHQLNRVIQRLIGITNSQDQDVTTETTDGETTESKLNEVQPPAVLLEEPGDEHCSLTCGGCIRVNAKHQTGRLSSPLYPHYYPANQECVWKLIVPRGFSLRIRLHELDIEEDSDCIYDFLDILNTDANGAIVRHQRWCGSQVPAEMTTNPFSVAVVRFHSDGSYSGKGFLLSYVLEAANASTHCGVHNGGCAHTCLTDSRGYKMNCSCRKGYALQEDGYSCEDINECKTRTDGCEHRCTNTEGSFQCRCRVGYSLNSDQRTCRPCGGILDGSGVLDSPGYPSPYPSNQYCEWIIEPRPSHSLKITVSSVDIEPSNKCKDSFLKLQYGHFPHQSRLCGYPPEITYVVHSSMFVRFHTGSKNKGQHTGFRLRYKQVLTEQLSPDDTDFAVVNGEPVPYRRRLWI